MVSSTRPDRRPGRYSNPRLHPRFGVPRTGFVIVRILHVLAPAPFGGLERVVQDLSGAQGRAGHRVLVAAVGQAKGEVEPFLDSLESVHVEGEALLVPPRGYRAERRRLREISRAWGAEIFHTHGYRPDVVDGGIGRRMGLGTVTTVHGFTGGGLRNRFYEWLQCRSYRRFDAVVAVSGKLREDLRARGVPETHLHVVRNAIAEPMFLPEGEARAALDVDPAAFHIGWVGRLSSEKGPDLLLEALASLPVIAGLTVSIIGTGPMEVDLQRFSQEHGLSDTVRFHGKIAGASSLFRGFDLLALTSRTEGTPISILEGMAAGNPILATRVGGIPEMLSEEEAYLVSPDEPPEIAQAIAVARGDPAHARKLGNRARSRFERQFRPEDWVAAYDGVYESALANRSASTSASRSR